MGKVMVTLRAPEGPPSLEAVRQKFGLAADEIDPSFGVVSIDPADHSYTILVDERAAAKVTGTDWSPQGPYSNPRIEPFGPPK